MAYYKTVFKLVALSDFPYSEEFPNINQIAYDVTEGDVSGSLEIESQEEISPEQMAEELIAQGSDPEFLLDKEEVSEWWKISLEHAAEATDGNLML